MRGIRIDVVGGRVVGSGLKGPTTTRNERTNGEGKGEHEVIERNPGIKKLYMGGIAQRKRGDNKRQRKRLYKLPNDLLRSTAFVSVGRFESKLAHRSHKIRLLQRFRQSGREQVARFHV